MADSNPGVVAAPILQIPIGARAVSMGAAFTAVADDMTGMEYNPAGLALLKAYEANFQYNRGLSDQNVEYLGFGGPLPFAGLTGNGYATMGGSMLFAQNGTIQVNTTNPDGSLASSQSLNAGNDFVFTAGYAERVWDVEIRAPQNYTFHLEHFLGGSGRIIHSSLVEQYSATAYATNFGYLVRCPEQSWRAGISILNLGTKMTFISDGDKLPLTMRLGVAYDLTKLPATGQSLTLAADSAYSVYERQWHTNAGVEYSFMPMVKARLGYQFQQDLAGLTAGFGIEYQGFTIDYAWMMNSDINDTHRVGISYRFGGPGPEQRAEKRQQRIESFPQPQSMQDLNQKTPEKYELPKKPRENPPPRPGEEEPVWIY
jgi:hypothetical protein